MQVLPLLPLASIDLLIADATHNLSKSYNGSTFSKQSQTEYEAWTNAWVELAVPLLNPTASVYACSARRSSGMIQRVLVRHFIIKS
jgi:site-specific DNA-methyltransferase (adenine-specific)